MSLFKQIAFVVLCLTPVAVVLASLATALGSEPRWPSIPALIAFGFALYLGLVNFWLSYGGYFFHRYVRGRDPETYHSGSGIPVIASGLVVVASALSFGNMIGAITSLFILVVDTGGTPWALAILSQDPAFRNSDSDQ